MSEDIVSSECVALPFNKKTPQNFFCLWEQAYICELLQKFAVMYTNQGKEGSVKKGDNTATSRDAVQSEGVQHLGW